MKDVAVRVSSKLHGHERQYPESIGKLEIAKWIGHLWLRKLSKEKNRQLTDRTQGCWRTPGCRTASGLIGGGRGGACGDFILGSTLSLPRVKIGITLSLPMPALQTGQSGVAWEESHGEMHGQLEEIQTFVDINERHRKGGGPVEMPAEGDDGIARRVKANVALKGTRIAT